jgi:hypothetical protein
MTGMPKISSGYGRTNMNTLRSIPSQKSGIEALKDALKSHVNTVHWAVVEIHFTVPESRDKGYVNTIEVKTACYSHKQGYPGHYKKYLRYPSMWALS